MFKKSTVIAPKVGDQYVNVTGNANQMTSDQSLSNELYSSEGRSEVLESSNYLMPWDSSSNQNINGTNTINISGGTRDNGMWSQFLSEDLLNLPTSSSFPNYGATPYPPSKVVLVISFTHTTRKRWPLNYVNI